MHGKNDQRFGNTFETNESELYMEKSIIKHAIGTIMLHCHCKIDKTPMPTKTKVAALAVDKGD